MTDVWQRVTQAIQDAITAGHPLGEIRRQLANIGVRYTYSTRHQGTRETQRRRRAGNLCNTGCGQYANWATNPRCFDCRAKDWV